MVDSLALELASDQTATPFRPSNATLSNAQSPQIRSAKNKTWRIDQQYDWIRLHNVNPRMAMEHVAHECSGLSGQCVSKSCERRRLPWAPSA